MCKTREEWLEGAVERLRAFFKGEELPLPDAIKVSCSWPTRGGLSKTRRVVGQCMDPACSAGGATEVFISPLLRETVGDDGQGVLPTLVHELAHAAVGVDAGHGPEFLKAARKLGLVGKATATAAGEALRERLHDLADELGDYPHHKVLPKEREAKKKDTGNRQRKICCPRPDLHENKEDYILRASKKVIELGLPDCPLCGEILAEEEETNDPQPEN